MDQAAPNRQPWRVDARAVLDAFDADRKLRKLSVDQKAELAAKLMIAEATARLRHTLITTGNLRQASLAGLL